MQQPMNTSSGGALGFISQVVNDATQFPGELMAFARNLNDDLIDYAGRIDRFTSETAGTARQNLTSNQVQSYGSQAASWLSDPTNAIIAALAVVLLIVGVRKL